MISFSVKKTTPASPYSVLRSAISEAKELTQEKVDSEIVALTEELGQLVSDGFYYTRSAGIDNSIRGGLVGLQGVLVSGAATIVGDSGTYAETLARVGELKAALSGLKDQIKMDNMSARRMIPFQKPSLTVPLEKDWRHEAKTPSNKVADKIDEELKSEVL